MSTVETSTTLTAGFQPAPRPSLSLTEILADLFCTDRKFLVYNLLSRNLKIKYRRSLFGFLWTLLYPLGIAFIYYNVFRGIFKLSVPRYPVVLMTGMISWTFFMQTLMEGMESIFHNRDLISKVPIQIQVFPWVGALTNWITYVLSMPVLIAAAWMMGVNPLIYTPILFLMSIVLLIMAYSLALLLAIGYVFLGDLRHLMGIFGQIWFYGTPIVYAESMFPLKYRFLLALNPVGDVFVILQRTILSSSVPQFKLFGVCLFWMVVLLGSAATMYRLLRSTVKEYV